jgi:hypothetical protein
MRVGRWFWAALAAGLVSACGGGGGDGGGNAGSLPAPVANVTVNLATSPAGLKLTLDGQDAPASFSDAPGTSHTISAPNQVLNGRLYEFQSWSQGGTATQTITTPAANTTWTATFTDRGPTTNTPPQVVLMTAPTTGRVGVPVTMNAAAQDNDPGDSIARVQFLVDGVAVAETTVQPYTAQWTPQTAGVHKLRVRAFDSFGLSKDGPLLDITISP